MAFDLGKINRKAIRKFLTQKFANHSERDLTSANLKWRNYSQQFDLITASSCCTYIIYDIIIVGEIGIMYTPWWACAFYADSIKNEKFWFWNWKEVFFSIKTFLAIIRTTMCNTILIFFFFMLWQWFLIKYSHMKLARCPRSPWDLDCIRLSSCSSTECCTGNYLLLTAIWRRQKRAIPCGHV